MIWIGWLIGIVVGAWILVAAVAFCRKRLERWIWEEDNEG